jgi:RNA polymerase sigma factor (sigma-70 family)
MQAHQDLVIESAYAEHRATLVRNLSFRFRDPEAAEDLAQEAFLRLAREVEAGRVPDNVGAWLYRVAMNLALSEARRAKVATRHEQTLPRPAAPDSPEQIVIEGELTAAVGAVLAQLSAHERHALLLAANGVGGMEIATWLGRTPAATRTLMCRARAKIRERMQLARLAPI